MLSIPPVPLILSVNGKLNVALLQADIVVIDILNTNGRRIYLRINLNTLRSIRQRKTYKSLANGNNLKIDEEGEVAMVHRWNITFGKRKNYAYEIHFNCNLHPTPIELDQ